MKLNFFFNPAERFLIRLKINNKYLRFFLKVIFLEYFIIFLVNTCFKVYLIIIARNLTKKIIKRTLKKKIKYELNYPKKVSINYELSIAIPCYSRTKKIPILLDKALDKLNKALENTNLNYEVCIFDNGGEFSILEVIKKYKNLKIKYKRSAAVLEPNLSWFSAVEMTSGNYIHIHSCDDEVDINFYNSFENIIKNQTAEIIYTRAKNLFENQYSDARYDWYWNWPANKSCFFSPKLSWIKHPMPSGAWVCKREFYEKRGVTACYMQGLDLDLSVRFSIYIKEAYFSYNSFLYYRTHSDSGNALDNPKHVKEFAWHIFKIGNVLNHLDYKTSKKEINEIIYNYIKHYALLHAIFPIIKTSHPDFKKNEIIFNKLFKFKYFNYIYKKIFQFLNNVVEYDNFRKEDIVDKSFLNNKKVLMPNIEIFPFIKYFLINLIYIVRIILGKKFMEDRDIFITNMLFVFRKIRNKNKFNKKINHNFFDINKVEFFKKIFQLKNINSYCEIGCDNNEVFGKIKKDKSLEVIIGVDPVKGGNIRKTSDDFFKTNIVKFDFIFIDGFHQFDQVLRDFVNSLKATEDNKIIVIDDCLPSAYTEQCTPRQQLKWTGDVWKLLFLIYEMKFDYIISNCESGLGIIKSDKNKINDIKKINVEKFKNLSFEYFFNNYNKLNIKSYAETLNFLKE